jgi:hypothetical protein
VQCLLTGKPRVLWSPFSLIEQSAIKNPAIQTFMVPFVTKAQYSPLLLPADVRAAGGGGVGPVAARNTTNGADSARHAATHRSGGGGSLMCCSKVLWFPFSLNETDPRSPIPDPKFYGSLFH